MFLKGLVFHQCSSALICGDKWAPFTMSGAGDGGPPIIGKLFDLIDVCEVAADRVAAEGVESL